MLAVLIYIYTFISKMKLFYWIGIVSPIQNHCSYRERGYLYRVIAYNRKRIYDVGNSLTAWRVAPTVNPTADAPATCSQHDAIPGAAPVTPLASKQLTAKPSTPTTTTTPSVVVTGTAVPSTSHKQPRHPPAYHPPKAPRRPARESALRAAKALHLENIPNALACSETFIL